MREGIEKRLGTAYRLHNTVESNMVLSEATMGAPITAQEYR